MSSLCKDIETSLSGDKDQVLMGTFDDGVRFNWWTSRGSSLLLPGGIQLSQDGKKVLQVVA
ncbi:hypothetical protein DFAR_750009 [Desulfarculales bacterium]